jgi:tetratricopeptide (TPR) repeat protein/tRNA A-37 threonylcarbamoyl transferase component Bud32
MVQLPHTGPESGTQPRGDDETRRVPPANSGSAAAAGRLFGPGSTIGRYRLVELIGEGGFGAVWRAEQMGSLRREVALKLVKPGMDSREIIARVDSERRALALMDHPNIAAVFDAGTTESGQPYFVMELVRGRPVTTYCDDRRLSVRERLELFLPICQAVQHAHQKAILHRDLKPSNILVVEVDGRPVPKVIDFGVAKALAPSPEDLLEASLARSLESMLVGTPQYMSPEQAGCVPDVDTRSDIYALGIILHELLTGSPPLTRTIVRSMTFEAVLAGIRDHDIPAPSSLLTEAGGESSLIAEARNTDPAGLKRAVQGELDWVVLKAVEKDRERRYQNAADFAADVQRYLNHEPVSAGEPGRVYRLRRFVRRHRAGVIAAAAVFCALGGGVSVAAWRYAREMEALGQAIEAREREMAAEAITAAEAERSRQLGDFLLGTLRGINPRVGQGKNTSVLRDVLLQIDERRQAQFADNPIVNAKLACALALGMGSLNSPKESFESFLKALALLKDAGMEESLEAARCYECLARAVVKNRALLGEKVTTEAALKQAADWQHRCLEIRGGFLPADNRDTIHVMLDLGETLVRLGQSEEGMKLIDEGARRAEKIREIGCMARALDRRAGAAKAQHDLVKAEALAKQVLALREAQQAGGAEQRPDAMVEAWGRLRAIYQVQKNLPAAEDAARRVLEFRRMDFGYEPSAPLAVLGTMCELQGESERAMGYYRKALESAALHESRPFPAETLARFVNLALKLGNRADAEKVLREAVTKLQAASRPDLSDLEFATERLGAVSGNLP